MTVRWPYFFRKIGSPSLVQDRVEEKMIQFTAHDNRFRVLIEHGVEVITLLDEHFMPIYRSPASERLTGWTFEDRLRTGIVELTHPEDMEELRATCREVLAHPDKPYRISFRTLHKNGHYIWLDGSIINLLEEESMRGILTNLHDITESKTAENLLKESHAELRLLASHLQDIREEERTNMAREIHDELGQLLTGLKMDVSWLNRRADLNDEVSREKIKGILTLLDGTVQTVRRLAAELRPSILDDLGLAEALEWHCKEFEDRFGIRSSLIITGTEHQVPGDVATCLFRIYQEALTNVARHAGADLVEAELDVEKDSAFLTISDNGQGFDVTGIGPKKTLGLLGIKERTLMLGGRCAFISQPGQGTTIRISLPINRPTCYASS